MAKKSTTKTIRMSICLPVTVEMMVEYADDYSEAEIKSIRDARVDLPSVKLVEEAMGDDEYEHMLLLGGPAPEHA